MSRRIALPGADELFRSTGDPARPERSEPAEHRTGGTSMAPTGPRTAAPSAPAGPQDRSGARDRLQADDRGERAGSGALEDDRGRAGQAPAAVDLADTDGLDEAANAVRSTVRRRARAVADRRPSGRERHDEKITVYVSADELMDLEHARLQLRGDHGLPVDRGRVVREALAVVLADFEAKGEASILVRRLRGR